MRNIYSILRYFEVDVGNHILDSNIENISQNSNYMAKDWLFLAISGESYIGLDYVEQAIKNGAVLVFSDRLVNKFESQVPILYIPKLQLKLAQFASWFYIEPSRNKMMIGVTGTNGKSSICHIFAQILSFYKQDLFVMGTIGNGIWPNLSESSRTTSDCVSIQRELVNCNNNFDLAIMEVSSHSLLQGRVKEVNFNIAVWSNLTHDHLDYHDNMESYYQAKKKLFLMSSVENIIINIDDSYGYRLYRELLIERKDVVITTYSLYMQATIMLSNICESLHGFSADLAFNSIKESIFIPLIGRFNCENIAAVCALLYCLGYKSFGRDLSFLNGVKGRMQKLPLDKRHPTVIIDYCHTPDALGKALKSIQPYATGYIWCLFGCGGDRDKLKRPKMAMIAEEYADKVIITDDNTRYEDSGAIIHDIIQGFRCKENLIYKVIPSRKKAIRYVLNSAGINDIILIAGKGHEEYQYKNGIKYKFSEQDIIIKHLESR